MSDIVERLLWRRTDDTLVNPLGPEAADTITALTARVAELEGVLNDAPKAIRIAANLSPYADGMSLAFGRGLFDGYEAAAQVVEHLARAVLSASQPAPSALPVLSDEFVRAEMDAMQARENKRLETLFTQPPPQKEGE